MPLFSKSHKSPPDIVKNLRDSLLLIDKGDKKTDKAVEDIFRFLHAVKLIIYGQDNQEPHTEQVKFIIFLTRKRFFTIFKVAQLAQEVYNANVLPLLIKNLDKLQFESKKDVALIFNNLLRRQIGTRSPTVEYLCARPEILLALVKGCAVLKLFLLIKFPICSYENPDIAITCGTMLKECIRHEHLAKIILYSGLFLLKCFLGLILAVAEQFYDFFSYVEVSTFDIASDAFSTFKVYSIRNRNLNLRLRSSSGSRYKAQNSKRRVSW